MAYRFDSVEVAVVVVPVAVVVVPVTVAPPPPPTYGFNAPTAPVRPVGPPTTAFGTF